MNDKSIGTPFLAAALALCISFGALGAFVTGFALPMEMPWLLAAACAVGAVTGGFLWGRKTTLLWLGALCALAFFLWQQGQFVPQTLRLVYRISYLYNREYHWGYLQLVPGGWDAGFADLPVAVWGGLLAVSLGQCIRRGRGMLLPGVLTIIPVAACFVLRDTPPEEPYLCAVLFGWVLLALTGQVRRRSHRQANRLTLFAALPVAVCVWLLFWLVPREAPQGWTVAVGEGVGRLLSDFAKNWTLPSVPHAPVAAFWVLGVSTLALLLEGQRFLRRSARRRRQQRGRTNDQAVARWLEVKRLSRALREEPPEELALLTGKAKFSGQPLELDELLPYTAYIGQGKKRLAAAGFLRRLYCRYILAVL